MTQQRNIFGTFDNVGEHTSEVRAICEKYPRAIEDPGMFAYQALLVRSPWIAQLDEQKKNELRQFARDWPSLNRRRQEYRSNIPTA